MKIKKIFFLLLLFIVIFLIVSCPQPRRATPEDYERLFTKIDYGTLEWKNSYIISATNYLPQIQVWDSNTGKLVKVYNLFIEDRKKDFYADLWLTGLAEFHGNIWICSSYIGKHVARIETATGKMSFVDLDCHPETIVAFNNSEGGKGALWVSTYCANGIGAAIRRLDDDGEILKKCNITTDGIDISGVQRMNYIGGQYILFASSYKDLYSAKENKNVYWCVNLSAINGEYVKEIPYSTIFPANFFATNKVKPIPKDFISGFALTHQYDSSKNVYCTVNVVDSQICHRLLYKVNSWNPLSLEYKNIIYNKADARTMFNVIENNRNIFITGRILRDVPGEQSFTGLETGVYPIVGGEQIKRIRLPKGNQLYQTTKNGKTWFCKDAYDLDDETHKWELKKPLQIYMLEHESGKVYRYSHDGSRVELKLEN